MSVSDNLDKLNIKLPNAPKPLKKAPSVITKKKPISI